MGDPAQEWGLPDWQDAAAYGDPATWSDYRWRWEFFRRRDDLRTAFELRAKQTLQDESEISETDLSSFLVWPHNPNMSLRPSDPGFVANCSQNEGHQFGYAGIPNPRISKQPDRTLVPYVTIGDGLRLSLGRGERYLNAENVLVNVRSWEAAVVFNLDLPIGPQIKSAKSALETHQAQRPEAKKQERRHKDKWLTYLRVLDGRECGATWSKIAPILTAMARTEQAARDVWTQAKALRFNF